VWSWSGHHAATKDLSISWDALIKGKPAPAGVYLLKVKNASSELVKKFSIFN